MNEQRTKDPPHCQFCGTAMVLGEGGKWFIGPECCQFEMTRAKVGAVEPRTSDDLVDRLRARAFEFYDNGNGHVDELASEAAAEIERLRHDITRSMANHVADLNAQPPSNPIADDRLRNTRAWAASRIGSLSGAEVIVGAIDELLARRAADETADSYGCTGCRSTPCICDQLTSVVATVAHE